MQSHMTSQQSGGITKVSTGIKGFDEITGGGLPETRTTLIMGGPGCGKTVFALQMLVNGVRYQNEPGVFVALEENSRQIITNAAPFGWQLAEMEQQGRLFFLDVHLSPNTIRTGGLDLTGTLAIIKAKADAMGARRIVFDSLDVLLTLLDNVARERQELYRIHDWLANNSFTGIITARMDPEDPLASQRYNFMQFMVDCVVQLNRRITERVSLRELCIIKYRGSGFATNEVPFVIGAAGIDIAGVSMAEPDYPVSTERCSSGIDRLDTMLNGGYYRGSSVLITGAPGSAKTTLCGAFTAEACRRGEAVLYISFDETPREILRNLTSVNINLEPYRAAGLLKFYTSPVELHSAEAHLVRLRTLFDEQKPRCVVVDPLSALVKSGGQREALSSVHRLMRYAKAAGITVVCTSLLDTNDPETESSQLQISTIADTWIHLSYVVHSGERNRTLTIVKSRGTRHSHQVRELVLNDEGVTLSNVYAAGGEVLMGTLRWEREQAEELEHERMRTELERKRLALELFEAETSAQIDTLRRNLEAQRAELHLLANNQALHERRYEERQRALLHMRGADRDTIGGHNSHGNAHQLPARTSDDAGTEA